MPTLTTAEARRFYDRFGAKQDKQDFYEAPAIEVLLAHGDFTHARSVFELGCGTGRLALTLFERFLPPTATYRALEISSTMAALARDRLSPFSERAEISIDSGETNLPVASRSADRFVATYVFDLLSAQAVQRMLTEAQRILEPGGLLCLAGLTDGTTVLSRVVMSLWRGLFRLTPSLLGGCRPIRLREHISAHRWKLEHHRVVVAYGIASETLIARRR